jgi:uncharacterized protein DUF6010
VLLSLIEKRPNPETDDMAISPSVIAFGVILALYITVGVFAAIGTAYVSKSLLSPKFEQVFYAVYLAMIAGFYLAFTVYFGSEQAWWVESTAVLCFALIALAGIRVPHALIAGYLLHGLWDVIHELHAHAGLSIFEPGQTTAIPLAYGAFCGTYDFCMAGYFFTRRAHWNAAWTGA